ncbi:hypothetical protein U1Q18_051362 [Sarracenia purpurea var. burkii]
MERVIVDVMKRSNVPAVRAIENPYDQSGIGTPGITYPVIPPPIGYSEQEVILGAGGIPENRTVRNVDLEYSREVLDSSLIPYPDTQFTRMVKQTYAQVEADRKKLQLKANEIVKRDSARLSLERDYLSLRITRTSLIDSEAYEVLKGAGTPINEKELIARLVGCLGRSHRNSVEFYKPERLSDLFNYVGGLFLADMEEGLKIRRHEVDLVPSEILPFAMANKYMSIVNEGTGLKNNALVRSQFSAKDFLSVLCENDIHVEERVILCIALNESIIMRMIELGAREIMYILSPLTCLDKNGDLRTDARDNLISYVRCADKFACVRIVNDGNIFSCGSYYFRKCIGTEIPRNIPEIDMNSLLIDRSNEFPIVVPNSESLIKFEKFLLRKTSNDVVDKKGVRMSEKIGKPKIRLVVLIPTQLTKIMIRPIAIVV